MKRVSPCSIPGGRDTECFNGCVHHRRPAKTATQDSTRTRTTLTTIPRAPLHFFCFTTSHHPIHAHRPRHRNTDDRGLSLQGHAGIKDQIELPAPLSPRHAPSKINRNNRRGRHFQPCDSPQSIEMSTLPQTKIRTLLGPTARVPYRSDDPLVIHRPQILCAEHPTTLRTRRGKSTSHEESLPLLNPGGQGHRALQRMRPPQAPRKNRRAGQHKNQGDNLDLSPAPAP